MLANTLLGRITTVLELNIVQKSPTLFPVGEGELEWGRAWPAAQTPPPPTHRPPPPPQKGDLKLSVPPSHGLETFLFS